MAKNNSLRTIAELANTTKNLKAACKRRGLEKEYAQYMQLRALRAKRSAPAPEPRELLKARIEAGLARIAMRLPSPAYNMGSLHEVSVAGVTGSYDDRKEYSRGCKYSAQHGLVSATISIAEYLQLKKSRNIGGLLTILGERISRNTRRAVWFEAPARYFSGPAKRVEGYLYEPTGHHFTADSDAAAVDYVRALRLKEVERYLERKHHADIVRLAQSYDLSHIFVSVQDSLAAGNCKPGTLQFADDKKIDLKKIGAVRADYLQSLGNGRSYYVNKAIQAAAMRYARAAFSMRAEQPNNFL